MRVWLTIALLSVASLATAQQTLLNSSYDIARELFQAINPKFQAHWKEQTGEEVTIKQSHSGSSKQARAIMQGLDADVVTFNQVTDVNVLHDKANLIPADWNKRLPNNSSPYYSTTAFLVRKGNPKNIQGWEDLAGDDVSIVFPNPKTSGNGRYTYLAAWMATQDRVGDDQGKIRDYMAKMLSNVSVFDSGGRGATVTFVERNIGDVLISFESEVNNIRKQYGEDDYEVVVPKTSVLAEFPVTVVDKVVDKKGTREVATAYLDYLYAEDTQRLLTTFNYRVHNKKVVEETKDQFPPVKLLKVEDFFGSWEKAQEQQFASGGVLDQLQVKARSLR
ncbi:thiosulfate ABC transporter substrate-binding protein CysP [Alloalcanivorax mobilis]|uniref:thiosulfate ABC transporter substrate-binding protein CysP n=1 Tax=Alloalcanivorax mobilis TaxID=2019569 RepID=UPI000B5B23B1|nr:thiosulfate ABC transporter substrate-binding protein CysP [Alloalcanivorax mobilis]ASK33127.1 thiosulfate transporter subunit [Alcanivorax sp. N3-2A]ASK36945.1 thiosulfate transporter subunit [Alcanivorax sp. N3-2A]|tara:strand:+ start:9580 stop:10581 length:1002 start_codon:yes stop_codon:yes gene_type:complete